MNLIIERAARLRPLLGKTMLGFTVMGAAAARAAAEAQDFTACLAPTDGLLPRSFVSVDAMDWTPPADGQEVPPCPA